MTFGDGKDGVCTDIGLNSQPITVKEKSTIELGGVSNFGESPSDEADVNE